MYIVISESRGVEFASKSKAKCEKEIQRLMKDDKENGGYTDKYYIEIDESGLYKEGVN